MLAKSASQTRDDAPPAPPVGAPLDPLTSVKLAEDPCWFSFRINYVANHFNVPVYDWIAARFGLKPEDLPQLNAWMVGAGIRWGLDAAHRARLGLDACGDQNSALFGLHRMLLGYCSGMPVQDPVVMIWPARRVRPCWRQ